MGTMASLLWRGRRWAYIAVLHGRMAPSQQEWDAYCEELASVPEPALLRGIVVTLRGGPNARQRARNVEIHRCIGVPRDAVGCVVSDSAVVRGIVTALTWTGVMQQMHAFPLRDLEDALEYVAVESDEMPRLLEALTRLGDTIDDANPIRVAVDRTRRAS